MKMVKCFWMMVLLVLLSISSCGGGMTDGQGSYPVGGTVSGLLHPGLVLQNNGGDDLAIAAGNTSFAFSTEVSDGGSYNVSVKAQPAMQVCFVTQGSGIISGASVTNIAIICSVDLHRI
jgi:hypothetical protein